MLIYKDSGKALNIIQGGVYIFWNLFPDIILKNMKLKNKMKNNWDIIGIMLLCTVFFCIMLNYAGGRSMWLDEILEIYYIQTKYSLLDVIKMYANFEDAAPPLFTIAAYIWYRIVPDANNDVWLFLLPMIATTVGVFVIGMIGRRAYGSKTGIFCTLYAIIFSVTTLSIGIQFRQYAFLFLASAVTVYFYMKRYQEQGRETWRTIVLFGIAMTTLPYTHYVAVLVCIGLFISDIFLFCKKKITLRCIWSYVIGAFLFLPWLLLVLRYRKEAITSFWPQTPTWQTVVNTMRFWVGNNEQGFWILLTCIAVLISILFISIKNKKFEYNKYFLLLNGLWVSVFMISCVFIQSRFITPELSLYVIRYFIPLLPFIFLIMGWGTERVCHSINRMMKRPGRDVQVYIIIALALTFIIGIDTLERIEKDSVTTTEPYREAAEWLREQEDIYNTDTVVLMSSYGAPTIEGWVEHYVSKMGEERTYQVLHTRAGNQLETLEKSKFRRIYLVEFYDALYDSELEEYLQMNYEMTEECEEYYIKAYNRKD